MHLRTQIDRELNQRLAQDLCLMLSDVVGSTTFYQKFGDVQGRLFVQRHHDTLAPLVQRHGGKVIKTIGDAVMASFDKPLQAFECAIAAQQQFCDVNQQSADDTPLRVKISLHYGSALVEAHDVFGDLVNMSARLNSIVEPDQILISHEVYEQVKEQTAVPVLPLEPVRWKEGEKGFGVYEVLWQQGAEAAPLVFRQFGGAHHACFYCGLREHPVGNCPSKQLDRYVGRLDRLGYLPLPKILQLFQQENLNTASSQEPQDAHLFEAFYEMSLPYQLRFLVKVWLANSQEWREVERQQIGASPLAGTRLWMGFDCLRVGRLDDAHRYLQAAIESNPGDYKPYVALGFLAMEHGNTVAVLQQWRKALTVVNNALQAAYLHLLMYRFYEVSSKFDLAEQQLQKALSRDAYLHEAKFRRIALAVKREEKRDRMLPQLHKLIQDDRNVFLKVLLDPAFAAMQAQIVPLLSTLLREARSAALEQMVGVTEDLTTLRAWYQEPEADLTSVERAVDTMRQHIKSGSYFGYCDAAHEGALLRDRMQKLLARRQTRLRHEFTSIVNALQHTLQALGASPQSSSRAQHGQQLNKCQEELARLTRLRDARTAHRFWRAWKDLQALKAAVEHLDPTMRRRGTYGPHRSKKWRAMALFGVTGGIVVDSALFGLLGYLVYFSGLRLSEQRLLVFLICGGLGGGLLGTALGWVINWYRAQR